MKYKIIITAGGTSERIDNVRKITNSSSGKLGLTIAGKLIELESDSIDKIYYLAPKTALKPDNEKVEIVEIGDTNDLLVAVKKLLTEERIDYFIHSMAVSDYTVDFVTTVDRIVKTIENNKDISLYDNIIDKNNAIIARKISSYEDDLMIKLKRTPKVISQIKELSPKTFLVGFKLLDGVSKDELIDVATKLKVKNKCDLVVANDLSNIRKGNHLAYIIGDDNYIEASGKENIAEKLIRTMMNK